jgi:hypothetical protein
VSAASRAALAAVALLTLVGCAGAPALDGPPSTRAAAERPTPGALPPPAPVTVPPVEPHAADVQYRPAIGDCFDVRKDQSELREALVPCDVPHDDEIYHQFELPDGPYPGGDTLHAEALAGCVDRFADFIGIPFDASELEVTTYHAGPDAWAAGDRVVSCSVWDTDDAVVGTLRGAAY